MNPKLKTNLLLFGTAVFAVLFLFSGVMLAIQYADKKQSAEAFDEIAALIQDEAELPESSEEFTDGEELPTSETVLTAYDKYAVVYEQNPDFVGWISISLAAFQRLHSEPVHAEALRRARQRLLWR